MKFKYQGIESPTTADFDEGKWSIVEGEPHEIDAVVIADLDAPFMYHLTTWDYVNSVCTALGGVMMEPREEVTPVGDEIY